MKTVEGTFEERLVDFSHFCRERQFVVSPQQTEEAFSLIQLDIITHRRLFRNALQCIYCKRKEHFHRFNALFDQFWSRHYEERLELRKQKAKPAANQKSQATLVFLGAQFPQVQKDKEEEAKKTAGANQSTRLRFTDFSKLKVTDESELEALAEELFHQMSMRYKRKFQAGKRGKINIPQTIRKSLSYGGLPLKLSLKQRKVEKRKIVFLLDISGSMDTYSFYLLKYVLILKKYFKALEFFTFSTQLTHITPLMKSDNHRQVLANASEHLRSWSSGTKIGECLTEFLNEYGMRFLSQKHIVVILSDGLETGSVVQLRDAVRTIKRKCKTLIWLNPLKGTEGYQPIQKGMVNAMPHLDAFESGHNLDSLLKLEKLLMNV